MGKSQKVVSLVIALALLCGTGVFRWDVSAEENGKASPAGAAPPQYIETRPEEESGPAVDGNEYLLMCALKRAQELAQRNRWAEDTYAVFWEKYLNAKDILEGPASTTEDYRQAADELNDAIDGLEESPSYIKLEELLAQARVIMQTENAVRKYTKDSWQPFSEAYAYAERIYQTPSSSNEDCRCAAQELEYGLRHLEPVSDKSKLWDAIEGVHISGQLGMRARYTKTTFAALQEAYQSAMGLFNLSGVPQETVDAAAEALQKAVGGLVLLGDVNGDETVSVADVLEVQKSLACMITLNETQTEASDVDASGTVDVADAISMQKYLAGMLGHFPAGEQNI